MSIRDENVLVGINLGGTGEKRWDLVNFIELGNRLKEKEKVKVIYIWGPQEKDLVKNLEIHGVLTEIFPLPRLSALLKRCNLFITSDSGIMHLSNAVGTPTLAIFIHSDSQKFGPKGKGDRVISALNGKLEMEKVLKEAEKMIRELSEDKQSKIRTI
jgi:ADP-heptose:LPS heptosyltransferase